MEKGVMIKTKYKRSRSYPLATWCLISLFRRMWVSAKGAVYNLD